MIEVAFSSSFKRAFKKKMERNKELEKIFWEKLEEFTEDPFAKELKTHKLTGKLKDLWSFSLGYEITKLF